MANNKVLKRRVVVTGLGAITPIGNSVAEFWDGIRKGKVGISEITKFDTTDYKVKLAAEVKDFVPGDHMDKKAARRMEAFSQYAVAAAREAYEDSGLEIEKEDPFRAGVMIGSGIGSLQVAEQSYEKILTKGPARVNPLMVPLMISNMAAGNVSIQLGFRGKCSNVVTACATGTNCIGDAFRTIQYGDADMMLAGGTEGCVCPLGIAGFTALTALSASTVKLKTINLLDYKVIIGIFIGGMLTFLFSAFTMESVSKAAYKMIEEVRRQFREKPGIMKGEEKPDYKSCVAISTTAALHEMLLPGLMAVIVPVVVGVVLGVDALGGLLSGSLVTGVLMAIFMSNAGGAWDNAKKYIETGHHGGKGSEAHKAAVVGDTVGDPFKDTSGPSINILIKLMTVVSLVFAPLFLQIGGLL